MARLMRLSAGLVLVLILHTPALAQDTLQVGRKPEEPTVLLSDALNQLSSRFRKGFLYRSEVVEARRVRFPEESSMVEMLEALLVQHNLVAVRIGDDSFVILPYDEQANMAGIEVIGGASSMRLSILRGIVRDQSGQALPGAQVLVDELNIGDVTSESGTFEIRRIEPGSYSVRVYFLGFRPVQTLVDVPAGQALNLDVELRRDILQLEGIVTTATRRARSPRESALSLSVINSHELERLAPNSQADILRGIPGVHTEGGGGEVHSNVFIRGLPAPGQYKYSSVHEDGMPVISESRITGSAIDAYFRYDLGVKQLEFARGGSTAMYGVASPVGIINYISKTGQDYNQTTLQTTVGERSLYRFDFNSSGPLGRYLTFNLSGFYRFDEGPVVTGLPTEGIQLKGNMTRTQKNGYVRIYAKYINDSAQFFLPFPHLTFSNEAARGVDGRIITSLNASQGADFSFRSPNGTFESEMENGIMTRGPSLMLELVKQLPGSISLESKTRWTDFHYEAHLFLPFPAFNERNAYAAPFLNDPEHQRIRYQYTDTGEAYAGDYVVDQGAFHWERPISDLASRFQISRLFGARRSRHDLSIGAYVSRTTARQLDIEPWILTEFADQPRLLDLIIADAGPDRVFETEDDRDVLVTHHGLSSASRNYVNVNVNSNRAVLFAGDEMTIADRLRLDVGLRYETRNALFSAEEAERTGEEGEFGESIALQGFQWGNGRFRRQKLLAQDVAASIGANYTLSGSTNLYAVASRSHFFPELSALTRSTDIGQLDNERFIQIETGAKYGMGGFASTLAFYLARLDDRTASDIRVDEQGNVRDRPIKIGGSRTLGLEWTWGYVPVGYASLHLFGDVTYQAHAYTDFILDGLDFSGNQIERQPRFMAQAGFHYERNPWSCSVQAKYTGRRYTSADNLKSLDGYTLVNTDIRYTIRFGSRQSLHIGLHAFNVFNNRGLTEGDPRLMPGTSIAEQPFFNARPVLPRRVSTRLTFTF